MRFSLMLATLAPLAPLASAFVAWSGDHCNGDMGWEVPCDGSCHSFAGRHSFWTQMDAACVSFYTSPGCSGQRFNYTNQFTGACTNVNTGTAIESFACFEGANGCR